MPRRITLLATVALLVTGTLFASAPDLDTEEQKTLYAVGLVLSQRLSNFGLSADEAAVVQAGFYDGIVGGESKIPLETYGPKIEDFLKSRLAAAVELGKTRGQKFRTKMAAEPGAVRTDSGLVYLEQKAGTGDLPSDSASVTVHYHGTLADGKVFDSSRENGEPATFALNGVVPCFSEGIRKMRVGGTSKLVCPPELAYGDQGMPPMIPPGSTLVFEVDLLEVNEPSAEPATP